MRARMVEEQIVRRRVRDERVLRAMGTVPRHLFVPDYLRDSAYDDGPLPIGEEQTISQPYVVAFMSEAIRPQPADRVLEVGTGSGYQTAVLADLVGHVYSTEVRPRLAEAARARLAELGVSNVTLRAEDGSGGWPEEAPFDSILVTAAAPGVPEALVEQLGEGGRLVIPIGSGDQELVRVTRGRDGLARERLLPVRFVPLVL
ncbi:MAG TPA: protein-L-isoaspartate(D-aspartate) O-methyltransferase [Candidatus Polarisedimenticolia bacterium]|nr:protein-L-isoaspartate(D-aspartate) O-methyltransferase [Candidatus Polarisedimenticolia bacterium]